tara:strand:+ start:4882 stop:5505 length:624 start_codon:yes stop_codon:yes gene_type:complete
LSEKKIVIPGDLVTEERKKLGSHVFVENGKVFSDSLGLFYPGKDIASVVPLHGKYIPRRGDLIVGIVVSQTYSGYIVDINSIYSSYISKELTRDRLKRGAVISAKVTDVNEVNEADLDDVRVFYGGEVLSVTPVKIPRMIGKNGSMLNALKDGTGCSLLIGRNGWVWVKDGNVPLLVKAIDLIEREAHLNNLTNKVGDFLNKNKGEK